MFWLERAILNYVLLLFFYLAEWSQLRKFRYYNLIAAHITANNSFKNKCQIKPTMLANEPASECIIHKYNKGCCGIGSGSNILCTQQPTKKKKEKRNEMKEAKPYCRCNIHAVISLNMPLKQYLCFFNFHGSNGIAKHQACGNCMRTHIQRELADDVWHRIVIHTN